MKIIDLAGDDRPAMLNHLLKLDSHDRYMRFFAVIGDSMMRNYVENGIDFKRDKAYGVYSGKNLIALAHLSMSESDENAEIGISVDKEFRGKGIAGKLLKRILTHCHAAGIKTLFMSCLRHNTTMQKLAREAGLNVIMDHDEALARLNVSTSPLQKVLSIQSEFAYQQISIIDKCYRFNSQVIDLLLNVKDKGKS